MAKRQLRLGAFMRPVSIHTGAWRYPGAWPDANFNFAHIKRLIQKLEAGKFDAFFMADHLAVLNMPVNALKRSHTVTSFEPFTLLSALAGATEHIGLIATGSTTFDEPYHVARRFASLDHISGGRAGWNIVTTSNPDAALNFGLEDHMEHAERYKRAREFYDVVTGLWDSFADDAFVRDVEAGLYFDPGQNACARPQGQISLGARPAQHRPPGAGLARDRPGRRVGGRQATRGGNRGGRVHRRRQPRRRAEALCRHQGPHGQTRPRPRPLEDLAGRLRRGRRQRRGGKGETRAARQPGALRQRDRLAVGDTGHRCVGLRSRRAVAADPRNQCEQERPSAAGRCSPRATSSRCASSRNASAAMAGCRSSARRRPSPTRWRNG